MAVDAEKVQTEIQKVISEDPTIKNADRIIVSVEKRGFWFLGKEIVVLNGSVHSEVDKQKAEEIANLHSGGRAVEVAINVVQ